MLNFIRKYILRLRLSYYGIKNYKINDDLTIDVYDNVFLYHGKLKKIPFRFRKVTGDFSCSGNKLVNLDGCPTEVGGDFECDDNPLDSLVGGPIEVGGLYYCGSCGLNTLEGVASEIGGRLICSSNNLTDLDISSLIKDDIYCYRNKIDPKNYSFYGECKKVCM